MLNEDIKLDRRPVEADVAECVGEKSGLERRWKWMWWGSAVFILDAK